MSHFLVKIQDAWESAVPFQQEDAKFAANSNSCILGHKTGLGKTFISLLAWSLWPDARKGLICGTLASCATWHRVMTQWAGVTPRFLQGSGDPGWKDFLSAKEGAFTTTYASYHAWMKTILRGKPHTDVLIDDELHKFMRTRNQTWKSQKRLHFDHFIGASATWASRGPQDLYPVLNLTNHKTFSSYWRFVNTWCFVEKTQWGTDIYGVRNEPQLRAMLWDRFYRARTWAEVGAQFGTSGDDPVIRRPERVSMSREQFRIIRELDAELVVELGDDMIVTPNSLALLTRKLQLAISPKILLPAAGYGGPVEWLANKVSDDPHTVIFCPFREGLQIVRQKLIDDGRPPEDIFVFQGGLKPDEVSALIAQWKARKGVALVTVAFAQSFELDTTETAYFLGFSWDPNDNEQAEGRLRRLDSILKIPCGVTYIIPEFSDYEQVVDVVDGKIRDTRDYLHGYNKNYLSRIDPSKLPMV